MDRFRSTEVLLRILAFAERRNSYDGNLARFLNDFMHSKFSQDTPPQIKDALSITMIRARQAFGDGRPVKLSLVLVEALLVALYVKRDEISNWSPAQIQEAYANMRSKPSFVESARYAVTSIDNVRNRLNAAIEAFSH
jgi:hypothetical protein